MQNVGYNEEEYDWTENWAQGHNVPVIRVIHLEWTELIDKDMTQLEIRGLGSGGHRIKIFLFCIIVFRSFLQIIGIEIINQYVSKPSITCILLSFWRNFPQSF